MVFVVRVIMLLARLLGVYRTRLAIVKIRAFVSALMSGLLFRARETVTAETLAIEAISLIVADILDDLLTPVVVGSQASVRQTDFMGEHVR